MPKGFKQSEEAKAKMAAASKARWADPDYRERTLASRRATNAANGNAQQKAAAQAAAKVLRGRKVSQEEIERRNASRRANNGGSYWANGRSASINMSPGPAPDEGPQEYTGEHPKLSEAMRKVQAEGRGCRSHTEETKRRISEAKKQQWADGVYKDAKPATRRRVSRMELSLVPYLERLGYEHVDSDNHFFVYHPEKGMVPDFVDREGKRVFEFFGDFWHAPEDEAETIRRYAERGWTCTVLWEHDLDEWIEKHTSTV